MKKEIKGFVCGVVATTLVAGGFAFAAGQWKTIDVLENDITVVVDGETLNESNFLYNDRTYLQIRAVAEALDKTVRYDEATNTAYIESAPSGNTSTAASTTAPAAPTSAPVAQATTAPAQATAAPTINSNYTMYAEASWCPDFGSVTGATLINAREYNARGYSGYMYMYSAVGNRRTILKSYGDLMESLGFTRYDEDDFDNDYDFDYDDMYDDYEDSIYIRGNYTVTVSEDDGMIEVYALQNQA
ncbi:MAG TPA: copper amine oxidase N-terminal domain-containing protein [Firmicutes bacterium]|nr:copper amine oxidase N-terminal domain-containing protein [Bacillota bacterium]